MNTSETWNECSLNLKKREFKLKVFSSPSNLICLVQYTTVFCELAELVKIS